MSTTTRRTVLAGLAALPAVTLPALAAAGSDAALIAFAAEVEGLAIESNAALLHACHLENEVERLHPCRARPPQPETVDAWATTVEKHACGGVSIHSMPIAPDQAALERTQRQVAATADWEAKREVTERLVGLAAANARQHDAYARLEEMVCELTPMAPTTFAGLAAKARVAVLLDPYSDLSLNDWEHELQSAVLRDVARIGSGA